MHQADEEGRRAIDRGPHDSDTVAGGGRSFAEAVLLEDTFVFGSFRLLAAQRRLERDGLILPLGGRAFDILRTLVERAGQVVGKAELLRQVWPNSVVEEGSLRFHITTLRKALGEGRYIENVAGQGYSFVLPVSRLPGALPADVKPRPARSLPARPGRLVGRAEVLRALARQLLEHRFVTLVGPGGVGKTTVALALAHDLASQFDGEVCFLDVESAFDPALLAGGLAAALGVPMQPAGAAPSLMTFLRGRRMLLVLDGCEPSVDAAAALAGQIFRDAPDIHLLATSREALRADGEYVHRLFPLDYPAPDAGRTAVEALGFAAVQLFVERVASSRPGFALTDPEAPLVGMICRKLDGLALAIELAAGRVDAYGVGEVARQLESQFALMWPGRRTAVARHQTLSATLGWSHELLSAREQVMFRRLSVFVGAFTLRMATAVVADEAISETEATELLGGLVSKSLVQFVMEGRHGAYRLLAMTRSYAFDKLRQAEETRWAADRHGKLIRQLLESAAMGAEGDGLRRPVDLLDDVRAALEWSLSPDGDAESAASLAAGSARIWLEAGLLVECRSWMTRVIEVVDAAALCPHQQLLIQAALASAETFTAGFTADSFGKWSKALAIAQSVANVEQQLTCLVVLWAHMIRSPNYLEALSLARQADDLATLHSDQGARALADWMVGISHHHLGQLSTARLHLERSLACDTSRARQALMTQFGYDRRIPSLGVLSNLLWLEGRPDQALKVGAAAVAEARRLSYPVPLCEALTWQALNLHLRGDDPEQTVALLDQAVTHAETHFIESYVGLGLALKGLIAVSGGDLDQGSQVFEGLDLLSRSNYEVFHPLFRSELTRLQTQAGMRLRDQDFDALLELEASGPENWSSAEVKRNLGEILLHRGDADGAERLFSDAVECAERQGAHAWALRASLSLTRAATDEGARRRARGLLEAQVHRFSEGLATNDLQTAMLFLSNSSN